VESIEQALRNTQLFGDIPPELLEQLTQTAHYRTAQAGETLFHQGEEAHTFFIVLDGRLRLVQHSAEGKDVTMATFVGGDTVGLIVALTGEPYPGTAEVLEEIQVMALSGEITWQIMNQHAPLAVSVLRMTAARLHEAHNRIRELSTERVQQRIARSLLRLLEKVGVKEAQGAIRIDMRLSRQDLAQMNGATLETVSRTLSAWEQQGIVQSGREHITILRPHQLVTIAEDLPN
jgi:CRP/FNR family transcriptional regulator, nitrogen oxide reductase regulator